MAVGGCGWLWMAIAALSTVKGALRVLGSRFVILSELFLHITRSCENIFEDFWGYLLSNFIEDF